MFGHILPRRGHGVRSRRLEPWWRCPHGRAVRAAGARLLTRELPVMHGDSVLQLGLPMENLLHGISARYLLRAALAPKRPRRGVSLVCNGSALPLASESIDGIVLAHALEFDPHPHEVLREAARVLSGEGLLAILSLQPFCLPALSWRMLPRYLRPLPWAHARSLPAGRLCDWLQLLGLELVRCASSPRWRSAVYLLVARKRLLRPIHVRHRRQTPSWWAAGGLEPVAGVQACAPRK